MTQSSVQRKAKKMQAKAAEATAAAEAIEVATKTNGHIELAVSDALKYKLMAMQTAVEKHQAEMETVQARLAESERDKARVILEIVASLEDRLEGKYNMDAMSFITGKAVFSLKEPEVEEKQS